MIERGEVIAGGKTAVVRVERKAECEGCRMCAFRRGANYAKVRAANPLGAPVGATVEIRADKSFTVQASLLVYVLPLVFAAAGLGVGYLVGGEKLAFGLGIGLLAAGFLVLAAIDRALSKRKGIAPEITRILSREEGTDGEAAPAAERGPREETAENEKKGEEDNGKDRNADEGEL